MITVVLVDDDALVRNGVRVLLGTRFEISIVASAAKGRQAVQLVLQLQVPAI
jgi:DNA-binding NarL/FixJ family response regulator